MQQHRFSCSQLQRHKETVGPHSNRSILSEFVVIHADLRTRLLAKSADRIYAACCGRKLIVKRYCFVRNAHLNVFHNRERLVFIQSERTLGDTELNGNIACRRIGQPKRRPVQRIISVMLIGSRLESKLRRGTGSGIRFAVIQSRDLRTEHRDLVASEPVYTDIARLARRNGDLVISIAVKFCCLLFHVTERNVLGIRLIIVAGNKPVILFIHCTLIDTHGAHITRITLQEQSQLFRNTHNSVTVTAIGVLCDKAGRIDLRHRTGGVAVIDIHIDILRVGLLVNGTGDLQVLIAMELYVFKVLIHVTGRTDKLCQKVRTGLRTDMIEPVAAEYRLFAVQRRTKKKTLRHFVHFGKFFRLHDDIVLHDRRLGIARSRNRDLEIYGIVVARYRYSKGMIGGLDRSRKFIGYLKIEGVRILGRTVLHIEE